MDVDSNDGLNGRQATINNNHRIPKECKQFLQRVKSCDTEEVRKNPTLMIKCYPIRDPDNEASIFDELYCLLNDGLLGKSYKWRLLYFLNIALSSTKIPGYVVAAYIKKLSRLSLKAKTRSVWVILRIVGNLFIRHPMLLHLRDKVDTVARDIETELKTTNCTKEMWLDRDPFDADEVSNLKSTHAMDSFVWELMPLRFHKHPRIASAAAYLGETKLPEMEFDMNDILR